jgi:rod shape-determining protein MreD
MSYSSGRILLSTQREGQVARFSAWVVVLVPLAAILFQVYVPLFFPVLGYLEMPLLVVVYFALMRRNPLAGLLIGSLVGLVQDSLSKNPLGMFGIVKTLVGYFASSIGIRLDVDNVVIRLLLAYFFFVFHQFFYWVLARALLRQPLAFEVERTLVVGLLNAIVGIAVYHFLDKLRESS